MKRFFVLALALQLLTGGWFLGESFKAVRLCEHFSLHQRQEPCISWWSFMLLHYANPNHHQKDHESHSQLPLLGKQFASLSFTAAEKLLLQHPNEKPLQHLARELFFLLDHPVDDAEHPPC